MSVKTNVALFCKAGVTKAEAIDALKRDPSLKRKPKDTLRVLLLPFVAEFWKKDGGSLLKDGESKAKGTQVLDSSHKNYENAKRDLYDIVKAISSGSSGKKEAIEIPAELIAAAEKLAKLSKKYEQSRSLANKAVAEAFAQ
jgi:hypothetical protein